MYDEPASPHRATALDRARPAPTEATRSTRTRGTHRAARRGRPVRGPWAAAARRAPRRATSRTSPARAPAGPPTRTRRWPRPAADLDRGVRRARARGTAARLRLPRRPAAEDVPAAAAVRRPRAPGAAGRPAAAPAASGAVERPGRPAPGPAAPPAHRHRHRRRGTGRSRPEDTGGFSGKEGRAWLRLALVVAVVIAVLVGDVPRLRRGQRQATRRPSAARRRAGDSAPSPAADPGRRGPGLRPRGRRHGEPDQVPARHRRQSRHGLAHDAPTRATHLGGLKSGVGPGARPGLGAAGRLGPVTLVGAPTDARAVRHAARAQRPAGRAGRRSPGRRGSPRDSTKGHAARRPRTCAPATCVRLADRAARGRRRVPRRDRRGHGPVVSDRRMPVQAQPSSTTCARWRPTRRRPRRLRRAVHAATATGCGRWRCAPPATPRTPRTPSRRRWSPPTGAPRASAGTRW